MKFTAITLAAVLTVCSGAALAAANASSNHIAYMSGAGEPWNVASNADAMNVAFGAGHWDRIDFNSPDWNSYDFVYVDGGAQHGADFKTFVTGNQATIESYVGSGGRMFLNAATWNLDSDTYALGLGSLTTEGGANGNSGYSGNGNLTAAGVVVGLSAFGAGSSWSGNSFAHNVVSQDPGAGFTTFITGDQGQSILMGAAYFDGYLLVGGQTSSYFHSANGAGNPFQLRVNELTFGAGVAGVAAVPEPETYAMMLVGLGVFAMRLRKGRND